MIIYREKIEDAIKNEDIQGILHALKKCDQKTAINILLIDKHVDMLTKKANFNFLYSLFKSLQHIPEEVRGCSSFNHITVSNKEILVKSYGFQLRPTQKYFEETEEKLLSFIRKCTGLAIQNCSSQENDAIEMIHSITDEFNIKPTTHVKWLAKITTKALNENILKQNLKLNLLQNNSHKKQYVNYILNHCENIPFLDKVFSAYEALIYDIYYENKSNKKIWACLDIQPSDYGRPYVPNFFTEKVQWFEKKKIGYQNHPIPYQLNNISPLDEEVFNTPYFVSLMSECAFYFDNIIVPEYEKSKATIPLSEWLKETTEKKCYTVFIDNPLFLDLSRKILLKDTLVEQLPNHIKHKNLKKI